MPRLYRQLMALNRIENAYENWEDYRENLTRFILENGFEGGSLMIVGAGECNDFALKHLAERFSEVILSDIDTDSVRRGLERQNIACGRIRIDKTDLVGIPEERYECFGVRLENLLRTGGTISAETFTAEMLAAWKEHKPVKLPTADTVVCCGVHSQLFSVYPRMAQLASRYVPVDMAEVLKTAQTVDTDIARKVNAELFRAATRTLIVGAEAESSGFSGGVEGAAQALEHLDRTHAADRITELMWPFLPQAGRTFRMSIRAYSTGS
ncbi:MAG: hypothetical protein Q4C53_07625 [Clostridia bacterium]|nr:hypothetical protein [Clostridia bacterium]